MISLSQAMNLALKHHQANQLREAANLYQQILRAEPRHADALHLLGVVYYQVGKHDLAVEHMRAAIQVKPNYPAAHCNLGCALQAIGRLEEAVASFRRTVQYQPDNAEAQNNLGTSLQLLKKLPEALACYRAALRLKPDYAEAYNNLGTALQLQEQLSEAMTCYDKALRLRPDYAEAHNNLGNALKDQGRLDEAVARYNHAIRLKPEHAEAYNNLANALRDLGRLDEAAASCAHALRLNPNYSEAHNNLGNVLRDQARLEEAITCYRRALQLNPSNAEAHNNLANALTEQGRFAEAIEHLQHALRIRPTYIEAHKNLANVREKQGDGEGALAGLEQALRSQPNSQVACLELAMLRASVGDVDGAEEAVRSVLRLAPRHVNALSLLASLRGGKLNQADRAIFEQRLTDTTLTGDERSRLLFSIAHVNDCQGNYATAAAQLREGNALMLASRIQKRQTFDIDAHKPFIDMLIAQLTPAFFERFRGVGLDTERPVFIFGLPRSGTTLIEQVLAAHSQVFGAGELSLARESFLGLTSHALDADVGKLLANLQPGTVRQVAQQHLNKLNNLNATATRIIDKLPDNYAFLGLLAILFPRARFIHCRRDLRDVAVSCWMTNFRNYQWANDPEHIANRFRDYHRIMNHWRKVLPVPVLEVRYEETVADLPAAARRLVEWCGLDWEPACLAFHESKRPVRTASVLQVREPVHKKSVARWRHYEQDLGALFAALAPLMDDKPSIEDQHAGNGEQQQMDAAKQYIGAR